MKKIIISLLIFSSFYNSQSDALNHRKYWYYKSRLLNDFMKVGTKQGDNIIFYERGYGSSSFYKNSGATTIMKCGDATSALGYYLAVLATEYALLSYSGQYTDSVIYQIYCTLYTINRLDLAAEKVLNKCNQGALNGFFVRDDVYANYLVDNYDHFNYFSKGINYNALSRGFMSDFDQGMYNVESDFYNHYEKNNNTWDGGEDFFNSQDQIYALVYGLAFVRRFVPLNVTAKDTQGNVLYFQDGLTSLSDEAKAIAARLVNYAREPHDCDNGSKCQGIQYIWHITRPNCVLESSKVGADFGAGAFTYPLAESACMIDVQGWGDKNNGMHVCAPSRCKAPICNALYHNNSSLTTNYLLWNALTDNIYPNFSNSADCIINNNNFTCNFNFYRRLFGGLLSTVCYCQYNFPVPPALTILSGSGIQILNMISYYNNTRSKIDQIARLHNFHYYYHFPYSLAVLHNLVVKDHYRPANQDMIDLINEMSSCNHFVLTKNYYSTFNWATDTRTEHLEKLGDPGNLVGALFSGEYPSYDFLLYHNLWYLYHKMNHNSGIDSYMTDLGDVLIDKNDLTTTSFVLGHVDSYETILMRNTNMMMNYHTYFRAGKEIIFKPGIHIYPATGTVSTSDGIPVSVNSGFRAYIKKYECADDFGSYYPSTDSSYNYRAGSGEFPNDSLVNVIEQNYPGPEREYHHINNNYDPTKESYDVSEETENTFPLSENSENSFNVEIIPNPFRDNIHVDFYGNFHTITLELTDITGKVIYQNNIENTHIPHINLHVADLPAGYYMLKVTFNNTFNIIRKLIKN